MTFQAFTNQKVTDTPVFTANGQPSTALAGVTPVWTPGDAAIATLTPAADGLSAEIVPVAAGSYTYQFTDGTLSYVETIEFAVPVANAVAPGLTAV